jgi:uracil-DNA glycosylase family 4
MQTAQLFDSLQWYAEMGVDLCVDPLPQTPTLRQTAPLPESNRTATVVQPMHKPNLVRQDTPPTASLAQAIAEARAAADGAHSLADLETAVRAFTACALRKTANHTVFAQGVAESDLMLIGEAPGDEEDRSGVPFCGPSGQLLDKMLAAIGLSRQTNTYASNCVFWRPPGNRQPTSDELEICRPLVEKHIALVNPRILLLLGGTAASTFLRDTRGIIRLRGQTYTYHNAYLAAPLPVHVIYHPSHLLRQPIAKKQAWADLLALKAALASR